MFVGCVQHRRWASPGVTDMGEQIVTRNKYRVVKFIPRAMTQKDVFYATFATKETIVSAMEEYYPGVSASDGIPVVVEEDSLCDVVNHTQWTIFMPFLCSVMTLPYVMELEAHSRYTIKIGEDAVDFDVRFKDDGVATVLSPIALLFPYNEHPSFAKTEFAWTDMQTALTEEKSIRFGNSRVDSRAIAHGIAVKLKELEDAGKIDAMKLPHQSIVGERGSVETALKPNEPKKERQPSQESNQARQVPAVAIPAYKIISCKRDAGNGFSYRFVLELKGEDQSSLNTFRAVQKEFREAVKADYAESFPNVRIGSLFVDFPEYELDNGKIKGRAVVLTISVTSLTYDPNTRKGRMAVKVSANQYEEARKWIRKNIETLARDKNIALVTGEIPPAAKFYLGREELKDGNVLEIEFKTE